ncbi:MAG: DUF6263 family protein, partial [Verrucomicrobiota bacterium]
LIQNKQEIVTEVAPMGKQVIQMEFEMKNICRLLPEGDLRELDVTLTKVMMKLNMGGLEMAFDSSEPGQENNIVGQAFQHVLGKSFQLHLDPSGEVVEVLGMEDFGEAKTPFGQQLGPEQLKQIALPMMSLGIPDGGVQVGDTWDHQVDTPMGPAGNLKSAFTFTYQGDEAGLARMNYESQIDLKLNPKRDAKDPPMPIEVSNGDLSGHLTVDKEKRFPQSGEASANLKLSMPNPADPTVKLEIPLEQTMSFRLLSMTPVP